MSFSFRLNGAPVSVDGLPPTTTLLDWLRGQGLTGSKEGCAEGDCGACTVALLDPEAPQGPTWRAVCSCILLLPQLADRELVTVEGLARGHTLHPAQAAMVEALGSQCGYCTPGFVMSLFEACHRRDLDEDWQIDDQLCGNLCRCTGYRPIRDALVQVAGTQPQDAYAERLEAKPQAPGSLSIAHGGHRFLRPTRWEELVPALRAARDEGAPLRFVNGATDLGLDVTKRRETWPTLVDLSAMPELREVTLASATTLGAGVLLADLEDLAQGRWPALVAALRYFGSRQIKNRGTLGGNLCNASPIGDLAPALLAMGATALVRGPDGERQVPLYDFFPSYRRTALQPGELLYAVRFPSEPGTLVGGYKVSKRRELDISAVFGAFSIQHEFGEVRAARLAYGGMAATPARAKHAEAALRGAPWTPEGVEPAALALAQDFQPLSDHRGSAEYRAKVAANLLRRFVVEHPLSGASA